MATKPKQPRNRATPARRSGPIRAAAGRPAATADATPDLARDLRQLKLSLMATREKLLLIDPDALNDADHEAWGTQIFETSRAINKMRNAELDQLSAEFKRELPGFATATGRLVDDLSGLQHAADVIKAVAGVLGVVNKIIQLA